MPKSKCVPAKSRNKFTFLILCCGHVEEDEYTESAVYKMGVYNLHVTEFAVGSQEKDRQGVALSDIILENPMADGQPTLVAEVEKVVTDYPAYLNPFGDDDADQNDDMPHVNGQCTIKRVLSIDDYPEELNPFAGDEDDAD